MFDIPYHKANFLIRGGMKMFKKCLAFLTLFVMVFTFVGCSGEESPETAVTNYLNACKNFDEETISKYTANTEENATESTNTATNDLGEEAAKMLMEGLTYEILSSEENGDTATVKVSITNINMSIVMSDAITQLLPLAFSNLSEEEMETQTSAVFISAIENNKETTITKEVELSLTKGENTWLITPSEELGDALTGGLLTFANNLNESFAS